MARTKSVLTTALLVAGIAALGLGGYWVGRHAAMAGFFYGAPSPSARDAMAAPAAPQRPLPAAVRRDRVEAVLSKLRALTRDCPDLRDDWEGMAALEELVADLSTEEMAEIFSHLSFPSDRALVESFGGLWAAKDPDGALNAALARTPRSNRLAASIFDQWAARQPAEALGWLESDGLPSQLKDAKDELYVRALNAGNVLERDFAFATGCLSRMSEKGARGMLNLWGADFSADPVFREQLVDFAKKSSHPEDYAALNSGLLGTWPQEDSVGMMNYLIGLKGYLESGAIPDSSRFDIDAAAVSAAIGREYDRPAMEWWMERYASSSTVPATLAASIASWENRYPEKAEKWFAEQPPSNQLDAIRAAVIPTLAAGGKFTTAADALAKIANADLQREAAERLNYFWVERNPERAAKWRATLPAGILK